MKLYSGYVEIGPGKTVFLPRPMTWLELSQWRFGPMAIAGVGLQAFSAYAQGRAASAEAKNQQAIAEYNAKVKEQEAKMIEARSLAEARLQAQEGERKISSLAVGGVPRLLALATQAAENERENLMIGYEGQVGAARARSEAEGFRMSADAYGDQAKSAKQAGWLNVGTTVLSGFADPISDWWAGKSARRSAMKMGISAGSAKKISRRTTSGGYVFKPYGG